MSGTPIARPDPSPSSLALNLTSCGCVLCAAVYDDGKICLDILQKKWSPSYDMVACSRRLPPLLRPVCARALRAMVV